MNSKVVFATNNLFKVKEIKAISSLLSPKKKKGLDLLSIRDFSSQIEVDEVEETGDTFLENALIKAEFFWNLLKIPIISEDSGLCIPILGGIPGVYSARYGDEGKSKLSVREKNLKLLREMDSIQFWEDRKAYFQAVMVFVLNENEKWIFSRKWFGYIQYEMKGHQGFGYDPIFFLPEYQKTAADIDLNLKNQISHRAQCLFAFFDKWNSFF